MQGWAVSESQPQNLLGFELAHGHVGLTEPFPGPDLHGQFLDLVADPLYRVEPSLGSRYHTQNYSHIYDYREPTLGHLAFTHRKSMAVYVNYIIKWKGI